MEYLMFQQSTKYIFNLPLFFASISPRYSNRNFPLLFSSWRRWLEEPDEVNLSFTNSQATSGLLMFWYLSFVACTLYYDNTVYFKKQEFLFSHSINFTGNFIQK